MNSNEYPLHDVQQDTNALDCKGDEQVGVFLFMFSLLNNSTGSSCFMSLYFGQKLFIDFQLFIGKQ